MTPVEAAADLRQALDDAVSRLVSTADQFRAEAGSSDDVAKVAGMIATRLAALAAGRPVGPAPVGTRLARRIVTTLRRHFLDALANPPPVADGASIVRFLQGFDLVELEAEPSWDRRFADRLSGPDGLELVVEVAHDLRSPLTSILFLAETMQRGRSGPVAPLQQRQLGLIYSAAFGLSSVASDVIELARGGDRLIDLEPMPFSVADTLESVRDIVQPMAEEKGLDVRVVPPTRSARIGHPVALSRILLNLTTNALKFTEEGFVEMMVVEHGPGALEFNVRDSGRGIPAEAMTMLFEPFRRRQRENDYAFSSSGLGLSICRKLIEAMRGELRVETGPAGTRFFFTIELAPVDPGHIHRS